MRTHLRGELEKSGITVITGRTVAAVEHSGHAYPVRLSDGRWIDVDKVMFALGRAPNTAGLGLEAAGVGVAPSGAVAVDEYSRSLGRVYAVGDVTNRVNPDPVAIREGHASRTRYSVDARPPSIISRADRGLFEPGG